MTMILRNALTIIIFSWFVGLAVADDKSASSIVQLPSAGGTVTREEGTFGLNNNTGSANFRLPFPQLPQRGRLGPNLALTYNQFAGDSGSGVGVGWGIGLPAVIVNDDLGTAIPGVKPSGDFFSRISFQGTRLVFTGVEGGAWRYKPEFSEAYLEVFYHPSAFEVVTLGRGGEPQKETITSGFEITNPDGSRMIFSGAPAIAEGNFETNSPYVTKWPLVLQLNADRDAVRFDYQKFGGRSYLTKVSFAGGRSVYEMDLIDTRPSLVSHVTGSPQRNSKLYGRITAKFDDSVYAQWCLGYIGRALEDTSQFAVRAHPACQKVAQQDLQQKFDPNSVNVLDQLRVIYRFGDSGGSELAAATEKFPDITFDYSSWTSAELASRKIVYEAPKLAFAADIPPGSFELADMNMDALVDVVRTTDSGAIVYKGEGDLNASFGVSEKLVLSRTTEAGMQREIAPRLSDDRFQFADVFGDSFVDIVEIADNQAFIYDGKADGSFPFLGRSIRLPGVSPSTFTNGNGRFQDLNMDGRSDILSTHLNADGKTEWQIYLNLTRREADGGYKVNFGAINKPFPFESQDGQILGRSNMRLADLNGDRLPDLVVIRPADQGFCLYENQGNLFLKDPSALLFGDSKLNDLRCGKGQFVPVGGLQPTDSLQTMWYVDVNGDGILDFAAMGSRTDQLRVWLGFGDGTFLVKPLNIDLNLRVQVGAASNTFRSRVADLDGDGQSEIMIFQKPSGSDVKPVVVIDFNRTENLQLVKANLLTVVNFESGRRHDIRYATSIDEMLRDRANGAVTRPLHFPVILAKQMVTSDGVPGQTRKDVTTEEYFYHNPYYDVVNGRFIGFSDVEKVVYGDEFNGAGRVTQKSSIAREQYYTFAEKTADLHLAGKLKIRKTYEVLPDPVLLASAASTEVLDVNITTLHSLSSATREQKLPSQGRLLQCEAAVWEAVEHADGTSYLRKTSEQRTESAGLDEQQDAADSSCKNPIKTMKYSDFDDFNLAATETAQLRSVNGPSGLIVPGYTRTTQTDYAAARSELASLHIVNLASERRILSGNSIMSKESFAYLPEKGGRLGRRDLQVFSSLSDMPNAFRSLHKPTHNLVKKMDYDKFGNTIKMSDESGITESVSYDETGTLALSHTRHAGGDGSLDQITRTAYDGTHAGLAATEITPLGAKISFAYDNLGRKISERSEDGAEKRYAYRFGKGGLPSLIMTSKRRYANAQQTPLGESEWIDQIGAYNAPGNQIAQLENVAEGGVRVYNFALFNRNEKQAFRWTPFTTEKFNNNPVPDVKAVFALGDIPRPSGEVGTGFTYDAAGRVVREADPSGKISTLEIEPWGNRRTTSYKDQFDGDMQVIEYRLLNENGTIATIVADGRGVEHVTKFVRDDFGYLREIWLPDEVTPRRFRYNSVGDIEFQSIPGMGDYYYFYDSRGRQAAKARITATGETKLLSFTYDFLNRKLTESEDGVLRDEFVYDKGVQIASAASFQPAIALPLGNITSVITHDPNGLFDAVQRFGYDNNGRMLQNEVEIDGKRYAESFGHTLDGRINVSVGPRGLSSNFALGPDRNLRSVTVNHADFAQPEKIIENIGYNAEGRISRIDYRNSAFTQMHYDPATLFLDRIITKTAQQQLQDLTMSFNQNGSVTEIVDSLASLDPAIGHINRSGKFHYDFKNQLVQIERYGEASSFIYSNAGAFSRNDEYANGTTLARDPNALTGLIPASVTDKVYKFDGFGQLASSPRLTATVYDAYGRLLRAQTKTEDVFFGYDQTGRRIYKKMVPFDAASPAQTYFFPMQSFEVGPKGEESFVLVGESRLVRMEHGTGKWFYYLKDHLESSDYVMASDGTPVEQMLYRAYGAEHKPEVLSAAWASHVAAVSSALPREKTHHRFTGKYLDDSTGLYYYGARYYDPELGRFTTPDPLYMSDPERCSTNAIACNLFAYANNNPMAFIDPTGLDGVVAGDATFKRQVEENLQRIDPTARVDKETGKISQSWINGAWLDVKNFFTGSNEFKSGRELIQRVVDSPQTTTIQFKANDAATDRTDRSVDWTKTPGNAVIDIDPSFTPKLPEFNAATGKVTEVNVDPGVAIGHELIHATHIMAGQISGTGPSDYTGLDGKPFRSMNEEARTVGVGGTTRPDDITENDLRSMKGINSRNNYDPF